MVQLTREQRTFITKTLYETESVNVVAILLQSFTTLVIGIEECTNPLTAKFAYFNSQRCKNVILTGNYNLNCIWSFHVVRMQEKYHWKAK